FRILEKGKLSIAHHAGTPAAGDALCTCTGAQLPSFPRSFFQGTGLRRFLPRYACAGYPEFDPILRKIRSVQKAGPDRTNSPITLWRRSGFERPLSVHHTGFGGKT